MRDIRFTFRKMFYFMFILLFLLGCGLFSNPARERQQENEEISSGTVLGETVTAEGIGNKNAPVGVTDTFNSSQDYIYVVVEADYIEDGTTLFARWSKDGEPFEDSSEITADRDYDNTYVEFHLENLQDRMEEGDYSVQIFVNGNPVKEAHFSVN